MFYHIGFGLFSRVGSATDPRWSDPDPGQFQPDPQPWTLKSNIQDTSVAADQHLQEELQDQHQQMENCIR